MKVTFAFHLSSMSGHVKSQGIKFSFVGIIITLGIVYGDIGTSPLDVIKDLGNDSSIPKTASSVDIMHDPRAMDYKVSATFRLNRKI